MKTSDRAYIFEGLRTAVIINDDTLFVLDPTIGSEPMPCRTGDLSAFCEADNGYYEVHPVPPLEELLKLVTDGSRKRDSVFFMLASIDSSLTSETRRSAAELANELLEDIECKEYCKNVLLSQPLPQGVELEKYDYSELTQWTHLKQGMVANQAPLLAIWKSWEKIEQDRNVIQADEDMSSLLEALISRSIILKFSASILKNDVSLFNQAIVDFSLDASVRRSYGTPSPQLLAALRSELQNQGVFKKENLNLFPENVEKSSQVRREISADLKDYEIFEQVKKQQEGIRKLLYTGNLANVDRAVNELLVFNEKYGKTEHLAKTLCSLSQIALEANEAHLADLLITKAVELQLEDIVIYTSRADVSKNLGRFAEAAKMYEDVLLKYGNEKYALCGYADTLKDLGKLDDAEKIYGTAIELFPDDPVAANGLVGILTARGKIDEALVSAKNNVARFGDLVSRVVYSNLLRGVGRYTESANELERAIKKFGLDPRICYGLVKSLALAGRFEEALSFCTQAINKISDHPLPLISKGELLRSQGKFEESLIAYSQCLRTFTSYRPAQIGKASVLILLGRESEAAALLSGLELESEVDWYAYHTLCVSIVKSQKLDDAIEKLEEAIKRVPWQKLKNYFADTLGYAMLRKGNAVKAIASFRNGLATADHAKKSGILLLMSSAYTELGQRKKSLEFWRMARPTTRDAIKIKSSLQQSRGRGIAGSKSLPDSELETATLDLLLGGMAA